MLRAIVISFLILAGCSYEPQARRWTTPVTHYTPAGLPAEADEDLAHCRSTVAWMNDTPYHSENAYAMAKREIDECMRERGWDVPAT